MMNGENLFANHTVTYATYDLFCLAIFTFVSHNPH
jgi:hypothetical protein